MKNLISRKCVYGSHFHKNELQCYMIMAIPIVGFLVFTLYPMSWAIKWAWYSYDMTPSHTRFVGWENFITIFKTDASYWKSWLNTLLFAVMKIPVELPLAFFSALALNRKIRGKGFFRSMFFMPNVISIAIVGLIFSNMFAYFGIVNGFLQDMGFIKEGIEWFGNKWTAMAVLVLASIWNTFGVNMLYFLAALQNIPKDMYEAAELDGAGKWKQTIKITLPMMAPVAQIILMLSIMGTLSTSDIILVMTKGGPAGSTNLVMTYIINNFAPGFSASGVNLGYGCALSIVTAVIVGVITYIYMKLSSKMSSSY